MLPLSELIFNVNERTFNEVALQVFDYQFNHVKIYHDFCKGLNRTPQQVKNYTDIPFLPIEFFKSNEVLAKGKKPALMFESSGTTGMVSSRHLVAEPKLYEESFLHTFKHHYGHPTDYVILALLPSYLERGNSSLVYMADYLIKASGRKESGFFLHNFNELHDTLLKMQAQQQKVLLLGVTYALLDFAEAFDIKFPELIIMETGGMKGRRQEMTRQEVHATLCASFGVSDIHSEYGMTELLSQGYSKGQGIFEAPPAWMKILLRDMYDPLHLLTEGNTGAVNVIDLANLYSCSFIATSDLGRMYNDDRFEILGRMDNAEMRGCNLMYV